jgi:hypothetical protein
VRDRHDYVHALGAADLDAAGEPGLGQRLADELGGVHGGVERSSRRRIDVQHQMRLRVIRRIEPHQGGMVLDGALVGEPQQRGPVVAQRVGHLALRGLRPDLGRAHPGRRVLRDVLLHERLLTAQRPDHRQRPVAQLAEQLLADRLEVADQIAFRRLRTIKQRLVEVGQPDLFGARDSLTRCHTITVSAACDAVVGMPASWRCGSLGRLPRAPAWDEHQSSRDSGRCSGRRSVSSRAAQVLLSDRREVPTTSLSVIDAVGGRRSAATLPGYHAGRRPGNNGMC